MFKMNPSAKEFVPAHILKKRQEEGDRMVDLAQQLDKVNLDSNKETTKEENGIPKDDQIASATTTSTSTTTNTSNNKEVQEKLIQQHSTSVPNNKDCGTIDTENHNRQHASNSTNQQQQIYQDETHNNYDSNNMNKCAIQTHPEEISDLADPNVDDRFLLNAGEDICEFNGEQFIIPGDDEYEPATRAGYDFGNAEDNEDEDVCNAFEEFLENLPDQ